MLQRPDYSKMKSASLESSRAPPVLHFCCELLNPLRHCVRRVFQAITSVTFNPPILHWWASVALKLRGRIRCSLAVTHRAAIGLPSIGSPDWRSAHNTHMELILWRKSTRLRNLSPSLREGNGRPNEFKLCCQCRVAKIVKDPFCAIRSVQLKAV